MTLIHSGVEGETNCTPTIISEIESYFTSGPLNVLELGCGTGEITLNLSHGLFNGLLVDESQELITQVEHLVDTKQLSNIKTFCGNIKNLSSKNSFDIIFTALHLHHDLNLKETLKYIYDLLTSDGKLIIVDLLPDNGVFHQFDSDYRGFNGFVLDELKIHLEDVGFINVVDRKFYSGYKIIDEIKYPYSLFSLCGKK